MSGTNLVVARGGPDPDIEGEKSERPMQVLKPKEVKVTFLLCFGVSRACIFWLLENSTLAPPYMTYDVTPSLRPRAW